MAEKAPGVGCTLTNICFLCPNKGIVGFPKKEYNDLCEAIDNKDVGIKLGNKRYLDPIGFFSFIIDENKAAQNRASETQK